MKSLPMMLLTLLLGPLPALGESGSTAADNLKLDIKEWPVPWQGTGPRDPYVGPDGLVWFVGQRGHYVANFNPATEEFIRYDLEPGTGPHNLIVADDGMVWYSGNLKAHIGRLDPATGKITQYPMPDPKAQDPHTLVFDGQGHIWFTVQGGNFVGRLTIAEGKVELIAVPTPRARPYGIVVDNRARPWIVELGSNKLATVDSQTMQLQEIELPRDGARPRRVAMTSDGNIWYVDYAEGYLGRYNPANGEFREWPAPSADQAGPYAMAADDKDRLWFVETWPSPNQFVGFDPATEQFFSVTPIPSGGGAVRHMVFNAPTREIWFGTDTNNIGRALIP
jgi:virginiamycin B lyase